MNAYIFDVDGVITDPVEKKITKPKLVEIIASMLEQNVPVAFISGRGMEWLRAQVITVIEAYIDNHPEMDKNMLDNLYVSGEFSGVYALHGDGKREVSYNSAFTIPGELRTKLNTLAEKFKNIGFVEHEKQTQFTIEAKKGKDYFKDGGDTIVEAIRKEILDYPDLTASYDRIGMNVKHKDANKRYAIKHYLAWLDNKKVVPDKIIVFGDSPSDLEMGDELFAQKKQFEFVFVGDKNDLKEQSNFPVTITQGHCDAGTLEYLHAKM